MRIPFLDLWKCLHSSQDTFPVRDELLSDLSDDDMQLGKVPEVQKPTSIFFKHKDDTDLFGLGIQDDAEAIAKDSSEDQEGKMMSIPETHSYIHMMIFDQPFTK